VNRLLAVAVVLAVGTSAYADMLGAPATDVVATPQGPVDFLGEMALGSFPVDSKVHAAVSGALNTEDQENADCALGVDAGPLGKGLRADCTLYF
jgi:hypothetical protein